MSTRRFFVAVLALLLAGAPSASAQTKSPTSAGIRKELVWQLGDAEQKLVALAQAVPDTKYSWRPAQGVRSISEVYMHVVGANFMIPGMAGVKKPTGVTLPKDAETAITDKAQVVDLLKKSFAYAKDAVMTIPDDQMDASVVLFGQPTTKRGVMVLITTHAHEHLGQSIAYARTNGVVPPWSMKSGGNQ